MQFFPRYCLIQVIAIITTLQLWAQDPARPSVPAYTPQDAGSAIRFTVKNLGFNVRGSFTGLRGSIIFDPQDLSRAVFDVSIDAASINTDNSMRDDHLRSDDYFDVHNYPRIRIQSSSVSASGGKGNYVLSGKLTIRNITRDISIPFSATPSGDGYLFTGEFRINRRDFNIGGISTISNNLIVSLSVLAKGDKR